MRRIRQKALHAQAFEAGREGDVIVSHEYRRLKRAYKNKHHAMDSPNADTGISAKPGFSFLPKYSAIRKAMAKRDEASLIDKLRGKK